MTAGQKLKVWVLTCSDSVSMRGRLDWGEGSQAWKLKRKNKTMDETQ